MLPWRSLRSGVLAGSCPGELCEEGAACRAVPLALCKTVPIEGNCDKCQAKFFVDTEEVSCSVDFCKPPVRILASDFVNYCGNAAFISDVSDFCFLTVHRHILMSCFH